MRTHKKTQHGVDCFIIKKRPNFKNTSHMASITERAARRMDELLKQAEARAAQAAAEEESAAMKQGAVEFLVKPFSRESLLAAVAKAIEIDIQQMHEVVRKSEFEQKLTSLSPRERQVFGLLAKGYSNTELVEELGVALSTVKEYKSEVMYKLRLRSLSELIALNNNT
jgi:FixJ family two-component response regulator